MDSTGAFWGSRELWTEEHHGLEVRQWSEEGGLGPMKIGSQTEDWIGSGDWNRYRRLAELGYQLLLMFIEYITNVFFLNSVLLF